MDLQSCQQMAHMPVKMEQAGSALELHSQDMVTDVSPLPIIDYYKTKPHRLFFLGQH